MGSLIWIWPRGADSSLERLIRGLGGYPPEPQLDSDEFRRLIDRVHRVDPLALMRRVMILRGHSWRRELDGVSAPVLIVLGEIERKYLSVELGEFFEKRERTVTNSVPGGHMPFLSYPDEFLAVVEAFLARHPG
jgi:pimeloyl-ACP methyl ester carboxylesterase